MLNIHTITAQQNISSY